MINFLIPFPFSNSNSAIHYVTKSCNICFITKLYIFKRTKNKIAQIIFTIVNLRTHNDKLLVVQNHRFKTNKFPLFRIRRGVGGG